MGVLFIMRAPDEGRHNEELRRGPTAIGVVIDAMDHRSSKQRDWILVRFTTSDGHLAESRLYDDELSGELPGIGDTVKVRYAPSNAAGNIESGDRNTYGWTSKTYIAIGVSIILATLIADWFLIQWIRGGNRRRR